MQAPVGGHRAPGGHLATAAEITSDGGDATATRNPRTCFTGVVGPKASSPTGRKQVVGGGAGHQPSEHRDGGGQGGVQALRVSHARTFASYFKRMWAPHGTGGSGRGPSLYHRCTRRPWHVFQEGAKS